MWKLLILNIIKVLKLKIVWILNRFIKGILVAPTIAFLIMNCFVFLDCISKFSGTYNQFLCLLIKSSRNLIIKFDLNLNELYQKWWQFKFDLNRTWLQHLRIVTVDYGHDKYDAFGLQVLRTDSSGFYLLCTTYCYNSIANFRNQDY